MKIISVDLYSYFKKKKNINFKGKLHGYILDNSIEINVNRKRPCALIFPGGGYEFTSFREEEPVALKFLEKGFDAFYLEYSCVDSGAIYPVQLQEAQMALKYLKENANAYSIDDNKIFGIGFSAGGHLLGLLASCKEEERIMGFKDNLAACIFSYAVISSDEDIIHQGSFDNLTNHNSELIKLLSIEKRINDNFPPSFIWHTVSDSAVNVNNAYLLKKYLDKYKVDNEICIFKHGEHGESCADITCYSFNQLKSIPKENKIWFNRMLTFLEKYNIKIED